MSVQIGEDIPIAWSYATAAGIAFDPLEVRLYVRYPDLVTHNPSATQTKLVYGVDEEIVRSATGHYGAVVRATTHGVLAYKTEGLGTADDPNYCKPGPDEKLPVSNSLFTLEAPTPGLNQTMYYGAAASPPSSEAQVLALSDSALRVNYETTLTFALTAAHLAISYPAAWGTAQARFVDGLQPIALESSTFSVGGVSYRTQWSFDSALTYSGDIEVY